MTTFEQRRAARLKHRYGLTTLEYDYLYELQEGRCAICGTQDSGSKGKANLCVDHDHETGVIRGLLCDPCNTGLGRFQDDKCLLQEAISYLEKHQIQETG